MRIECTISCYLNPICTNWITITCLTKICSQHYKYHKKNHSTFSVLWLQWKNHYFMQLHLRCNVYHMLLFNGENIKNSKWIWKIMKFWQYKDSKIVYCMYKNFWSQHPIRLSLSLQISTSHSQLYRSSLKILRFIRSTSDNLC